MKAGDGVSHTAPIKVLPQCSYHYHPSLAYGENGILNFAICCCAHAAANVQPSSPTAFFVYAKDEIWDFMCWCCDISRRALHRLLRICKAYDVVVDIWVSIPCTAGTPFRRINENRGAESGDLAMTYKLVVAAVGLCRHAVRIGGTFNWEWSNGNELWDLVVVRNLFARCGSSSCLVSTAGVGQRFVDREGSVFYVKKKWKIVTTRPGLIEVMALYARIPEHLGPGPAVGRSVQTAPSARRSLLSLSGVLSRPCA